LGFRGTRLKERIVGEGLIIPSKKRGRREEGRTTEGKTKDARRGKTPKPGVE